MNTPLSYTEYEARQHVAHVQRNAAATKAVMDAVNFWAESE